MKEEFVNHFNGTADKKAIKWSIISGLASVLCFMLQASYGLFLRSQVDATLGGNAGVAIGYIMSFVSIGVTLWALMVNSGAYRRGVRPGILWIGFLPTIVMTVFWIFMIVGNVYTRFA